MSPTTLTVAGAKPPDVSSVTTASPLAFCICSAVVLLRRWFPGGPIIVPAFVSAQYSP